MIKVTMISGATFYFSGGLQEFAGYVRSGHARGSVTLEARTTEESDVNDTIILLTNVESFTEL